ncbi:hypothetical protein EG329_005232 [Mollisiaceae sp. DMI_Dod_QoI]|nr:hypothetical protein EG329_005232 [Helotiales sp. DMI_Dod_QoI]
MPGVTNSDGSTITLDAENPQSENAMYSSWAAEDSSWGYYTTFPTYAELTTAGGSTGYASPTQSSIPTITTSSPTSTSVVPTVVPASTKSSDAKNVIGLGQLWSLLLEITMFG